MFGIGIFEFVAMPLGVCIVGGLILYFAVRRVQKKLDPVNKPTTWEFINELGGYALLAVILIAYAVITFLFAMLKFLF
jgi:uncharacterized iron-regulated membrane protein